MSAEERAKILNIINEAFDKKKMPYVVVGYDDTLDEDGFLDVLIDKKIGTE